MSRIAYHVPIWVLPLMFPVLVLSWLLQSLVVVVKTTYRVTVWSLRLMSRPRN